MDHTRATPSIVVAPTDLDGQRKTSKIENNHRIEKLQLVVTGQVDLTVAGTGLRNRGSILAALSDVGFTDAGVDKLVAEARMARFFADYFSSSALNKTRLTGAGVQAATQLREVLPLWLCAPHTIDPGDTKYVEADKLAELLAFITPNRVIGRLVAGAPTGTITNLQANVEMVYDDDVADAPLLQSFVRQIVKTVDSANTDFEIPIADPRYLQRLVIMQESDEGEVSDIINSVIIRGDRGSVFGDKAIPWRDLVDMMAQEGGPGASETQAYALVDFLRYGRLSTQYDPTQDTNLRVVLDVQKSVTGVATGSKVRVGLWLAQRTPTTTRPLPWVAAPAA